MMNSNNNSFPTYDGGFAGIDINNIDLLEDSLDGLIKKMEEILNSSQNMDLLIENAIKGQAGEAFKLYIAKIKELILAYISQYRNLKTLARQAAESLIENDRVNAQLIEEATQNIVSEINNIEIK